VAIKATTVVLGDVSEQLALDAVLAEEARPDATTCDVLLKRVERSNNWVDAFNVLIFLVAAAATAMLVSAVLSATDAKYVSAVVSGVGTVLASGAFAGLIKLRKSQQEELDKYVKMRKDNGCP
jgi:pheromone shutdown protein TraB